MTKLIVFIIIGILFIFQKGFKVWETGDYYDFLDILISVVPNVIIVGVSYLILF